MNGRVKAFSTIATLEGVSYILLLGIAMPLKYIFNFPFAVQVLGWAHGVLFVLYGVMLLLCWIHYRWSLVRVISFFLASLLPVLPFLVERKLHREYADLSTPS